MSYVLVLENYFLKDGDYIGDTIKTHILSIEAGDYGTVEYRKQKWSADATGAHIQNYRTVLLGSGQLPAGKSAVEYISELEEQFTGESHKFPTDGHAALELTYTEEVEDEVLNALGFKREPEQLRAYKRL